MQIAGARMEGASVKKTAELLVLIQEARKNIMQNWVIPTRFPSLPTELNALWEENIKLLPPVTAELNQHLNSPVSTKTANRSPSENLCFPISTLRRGWSGVKITRAGIKTNGCKWYSPKSPVYLFSQLQGEFMCGCSPGKLTTLTAFFPQWSTEVDQWWFEQPYRGIISVLSLPCIETSTAKFTWTFWDLIFIQWSRHYFLMVTACFKTTVLRYIPLMSLRVGMMSMKAS